DGCLCLRASRAARERLVITYVGQSISDNTDLPPSVVINELLDTIDRSFKFSVDGTDRAGGARPRDRVVQRHALQPFSPRYFGAADEPAPLRGEPGEANAALSRRTASGAPALPGIISGRA